MLSFSLTDEADRYLVQVPENFRTIRYYGRDVLDSYRSRRPVGLPDPSPSDCYACCISVCTRWIRHKIEKGHSCDSPSFIYSICWCIDITSISIEIDDLRGPSRTKSFSYYKWRVKYRTWDSVLFRIRKRIENSDVLTDSPLMERRLVCGGSWLMPVSNSYISLRKTSPPVKGYCGIVISVLSPMVESKRCTYIVVDILSTNVK